MTDESSQRVLIFAPVGRDAAATAELLARAHLQPHVCQDFDSLVDELTLGAAAAFVAEEGLFGRDLGRLAVWLTAQPAWSDPPFVILTSHHQDPRVAAWRQTLVHSLGNVSLVERPVHSITLTSTLHAAVRARQKQYEVCVLLEARERAAGHLQARVDEATAAMRKQMTERAQMEDALRQAQKMEAIGQLTGGVAHDFNNLLMVIAAGLDMIERHRHSDRVLSFIDSMRTATARGSSLTRQLLAFARRQALQPERVDLVRHLGGMRELLDRSLGGNVRLVTELPAELWPIHVDPAEMELVILNLAFNARDAMPAGGTVTLSGRNVPKGELPGEGWAERDFVELTVADTGVGMPPDVRARAFEPFFTTKEIGKGSGLGLAQTYGFAQQSGGKVHIQSELGSGTQVVLTLPRSTSSEQVVSRRPPGFMPTVDETLGAGDVLLVEDDDAVAELVSAMLSQLGYGVLRTASALDALVALTERPNIELVLSDIMMPGGMDGIGLARELRRQWPQLPVVLTTGHPDSAARDLQVEGVQLLVKPYRIDDLRATLGQARSVGGDNRAAAQDS